MAASVTSLLIYQGEPGKFPCGDHHSLQQKVHCPAYYTKVYKMYTFVNSFCSIVYQYMSIYKAIEVFLNTDIAYINLTSL